MMRRFIAAAACAVLASACSTAQRITGEPLVYSIEQSSGQLFDRDVVTSGSSFHKDEMVTIVLNNVFIKFLEDFARSHVLVYAEIYDDGSDDPEKAYRKVLYNAENTVPGVNLGLADRVLYGPTPYKGYPIRVRFFIVQLAKDQKQLASKMISAAGATGQSAIPGSAPVIGAAVQIAQAINALTEDDFELRFDLTLWPNSTSTRWDISDATLAKLYPKEPIQRQGKSVQLAMPLRTGPFVIVKREMRDRASAHVSDDDPCAFEAGFDFDQAQEGFYRRYRSFPDKGKTMQSVTSIRLSGGYLYWYVLGTEYPDGKVFPVFTCDNPDRASVIVPGLRSLYRTQTYAVMTVLNGMPTGLSEAQMRSGSDRDLKQIRSLLDNPDQLSIGDRIGPAIDQSVKAIKTAIESRRLNLQAARKVSLEPTFRTSSQYPMFWVNQMIQKPDAEQQSKNQAALATLGDIVLNLQPIQPDDSGRIQCLQQLKKEDFQAVAGQPGLFNLTDNAVSQIRGGNCTAKQAGAAAASGAASQRK